MVVAALRAKRSGLLAALRRRLPAGIDAEDVYQQGALRALRHASSLRDPARVEAWLRRVLARAAVDAVRRAPVVTTNEIEPLAEADPPVAVCGCSMARLRELAPAYRRVLERVVLDGSTLEELARELGITRGNAAVRVHRARRALQERVRRHCGVQSVRACLTCVCVTRGCCDD